MFVFIIMLPLRLKRSIYSNRSDSTSGLVKNWHLLTVYSYIANLLIIRLVIAVYDVYVQLRYVYVYDVTVK